MSFTSAGDKEPNEIVINTGNGAMETAENVEVFSRFSAAHGSRKEPSIAYSRERQWELDQEREKIELCCLQEELRLQQKQTTTTTTTTWISSKFATTKRRTKFETTSV